MTGRVVRRIWPVPPAAGGTAMALGRPPDETQGGTPLRPNPTRVAAFHWRADLASPYTQARIETLNLGYLYKMSCVVGSCLHAVASAAPRRHRHPPNKDR